MPEQAETARFTGDWLDLRAPADRRARAMNLVGLLEAHLGPVGPGSPSTRILDLGAGSGNNMRALAGLLERPQRWRLVDADAALLERARAHAPTGIETGIEIEVETAVADLAAGIEDVLDPNLSLVTASALFDLCGAAWLDRFAMALSARRLPLYAVLSYDGRQTWEPPHQHDAAVIAAFNAHQRGEKGFGPSLGPEAHDHLAAALKRHGYTVHEGDSPWVLTQADGAALIAELARGTATALAPMIGEPAHVWGAARQGAARAVIGHKDLLALPPKD
ncbi:MAG: class I SAM-dependent methyltransferase [Pseudomonadota bacterium]